MGRRPCCCSGVTGAQSTRRFVRYWAFGGSRLHQSTLEKALFGLTSCTTLTSRVGRPSTCPSMIGRGPSFARYPWTLAGGGSSDLFSRITNKRTRRLGPTVDLVGGRTAHTGSDESYFAPPGTWHRHEVDSKHVKPLVEGEVVRDWRLSTETETLVSLR